MNKQQTAVEWLINEIDHHYPQINIRWKESMIDQAKAMEKEQQEETFKQSRTAKIFEPGMPPVWENFEQYYNETYETE